MTSPFPLQPVNAPQAPYLRPDPVHEEPGALGSLGPLLMHIAGQLQDQQAERDRMTHARGQLALEQDKFDFEQAQAKDKKKRLDAATQALNQYFGIPSDKPASQGQGQSGQQPQAQGQAQPAAQPAAQPQAGQPDLRTLLGTIAQGGPEFGPIVDKLIPVLQDQMENQRIQPFVDQYRNLLVNDPKTAQRPEVQQAFLTGVGNINAKKADDFKKLFGLDKETTTNVVPEGAKLFTKDARGNTVSVEQGNPKEAKPISPTLSTRASFVASMANALPDMADVLQRNPAAATDAYNKLLLMARHPMIGSLIANVKGGFQGQGQQDDQQKFMTAAELWMQGKLGTDATKRFTEAQYRMYLQPYITQIGDQPAIIQSKLGNLERETLSHIKSTKRAFDEEQWDVLKPEAQAYLQQRLKYSPTGAVATGNPFAGHPWSQPTP